MDFISYCKEMSFVERLEEATLGVQHKQLPIEVFE
jgi:hypothetical protein